MKKAPTAVGPSTATRKGKKKMTPAKAIDASMASDSDHNKKNEEHTATQDSDIEVLAGPKESPEEEIGELSIMT